MSAITTVSLLETTVYGTASGNYDGSSQEFTGNVATAANYYSGQSNMQTALIRVTDFTGTIILQASLNDSATAAEWFDVYTYGDGSSSYTDYHPVNVIGNFVWMRAKVTSFDSGTIEFINLAY
jgi:hypothetical protein